jgi:hypothetical protein
MQTSGASRREIAQSCLKMSWLFEIVRTEATKNADTVIPGRCEASNPESRDSGFALARAPE